MHPPIGFGRRIVAMLAALVLAACTVDDAPTTAMSEVEGGPAFLVSPGFPGDILFGCTISWPVVGGPCESELGITADVAPAIHLDSLLISAGFPRELSSVPVRRVQYYTQNGLPIPPSVPLTITLSAPVRGMIVQAIPWVTNRTARVTVRLTEADGNTTTYELTRFCTFVSSCRLRASYTSDVGFTRVEFSVPAGDHFGASITVGGAVAVSNGVALTLSAPEGSTMPSELPMAGDACSIAPVLRDRSYALIARSIATGQPVANLPVTLRLGVIDGSGGHRQHAAGRPQGSFSATTSLATTEVVTDAEGRLQFRWYAPELAGRSFVSASAAGAAEVADTFTVGVALARMTPGRWVYAADGLELHDDPWHAAPQMVAAANALADSVHARWGHRLGFGDMSLPFGGRFDRAGDWADPEHCSHRWGNALDLRVDDLTSAQRNFVALRWRHLTGRAPVEHSGKFHLQTWREL